MTITLNLSDLTPHVDSRTWAIIGVLFVAGIVASILLDIYARHYKKKHDLEKLAKHWTALLLSLIGSITTAAGYLIFLLQSNDKIVSMFPFIEKYITGVVGIAYLFYNLGGNKVYQSVANTLGKWSGFTKKSPTPDLPQPVEQIPAVDELA